MELNFFTNLNPIGNEITKALRSKKYKSFKMAAAYAKNSGVGRLYDDLTYFANQGGQTEAIVGIDQTITSYQALVNLTTFAKSNLYIHHDKGAVTFHPKIYLFGNERVEKVFVGSSNLTAGGLFINFEANIGIDLDNSDNANAFRKNITDYWQFLISDNNTKLADLQFVTRLLESGNLIDENKKRSFREIIGEVSNLPFTARKTIKLPSVNNQLNVSPPIFNSNFAMILSGFDVSAKSLDPIQLIPTSALKDFPLFWNFPAFYTESEKGYPQLYAIANILIDGKTFANQHIRIYYYDNKKEFRVQCEAIKRNGNQGDIMIVRKDENKPLEFKIELLRTGSFEHTNTLPLLTKKVSSLKRYGYC